MKLRKLALAPIAAAAMMAFSMNASALSSGSWVLDHTEVAGQGSGPFGTVTVTETSANTVDVSVVLAAGVTGFVSTSDNHNAFTFTLANLGDGTSASISNISSGFGIDPTVPTWNTPYGTFSAGIICTSCGSGGSNPNPGPLTFTITDAGGISLSSFVLSGPPPADQGGWLFSADILANGFTGNVATNTPAIPEPETYAMMLAGLGMLGFIARRRRQGLGNAVPA